MSDKKNRKRGMSNQNRNKYLGLMMIPLILIVIVVVVMVVDSAADRTVGENLATVSEAQMLTVETDLVEPDNNQYEIDFSDFELQKDIDSDLALLIGKYCQAKMNSDVELLCQVFNNTDISDEDKVQKQAEMDLEKKYVDGYDNIACYFVKGPEPDTYVIYPYFEIKYRGAEIGMPCLTVAYAKKNEAGDYYLTYSFTKEISDYIAQANTMEDVRLLSTQIESKIKEATLQDEVLRSIYGSIKSAPENSEKDIEIGGIERDQEINNEDVQSEGSSLEIVDPE